MGTLYAYIFELKFLPTAVIQYAHVRRGDGGGGVRLAALAAGRAAARGHLTRGRLPVLAGSGPPSPPHVSRS